MKSSDAKKILSGEVSFSQWSILLGDSALMSDNTYVSLSKNDIEFMLRQLALKVVGEKEKGK